MPERERPSLAGLAINKKPLVERGRPVVPLDEAESSLLGTDLPRAPEKTPPEPVGTEEPAAAEAPEATMPVAAARPAAARPMRAVQTASPSTIQPTIQSPSKLQPRKKEIKIAWTFKIPHLLHEELSAVAAYNDLTMSDIVIEAIQLHLPNFPHPDGRGRR